MRVHGAGRDERVVIVHVGDRGADRGGPARPGRTGQPADWTTRISRPPRPARSTGNPRPGSDAEAAFLALGDGAALWLKEAAAQGTSRIRVKMAHAVSIAKLTNPARVDWALGHAAVHQRFGEGDLASILAANLDPATPAALQRRGGQIPHPGHRRVGRPRRHHHQRTPHLNGRNDSQPVEDNR